MWENVDVSITAFLSIMGVPTLVYFEVFPIPSVKH